jgi:inositol phosphorylceramide glucuronosyltransferase 1
MKMKKVGICLLFSFLLFVILKNTFYFGGAKQEVELHWTPIVEFPEPEYYDCSQAIAVVSQFYSDDYLEGVLTLGYSLDKNRVCGDRVLFYIEGKVSDWALEQTKIVGWKPLRVDPIYLPKGIVAPNEHFKDQLTKLRIWNLTDYSVVLYLDSDCLVIKNVNELFHYPSGLLAVGDIWNEFLWNGYHGFEYNFNAGVLVLKPSEEIFNDMIIRIAHVDEYDITYMEQSFLNKLFRYRYVRLPYIYNANIALFQGYIHLWNLLWPEIKILHYSSAKPMMNNIKGDLRLMFQRTLELEPFKTYGCMFLEMIKQYPEIGTERQDMQRFMRTANCK